MHHYRHIAGAVHCFIRSVHLPIRITTLKYMVTFAVNFALIMVSSVYICKLPLIEL